MQHVIRRELLQVIGQLGAVRIFDRLQHDVDLLENLPVSRIRNQQFRQPENVAGGGDLVRVLPPGDKDRRLAGGHFGQRNQLPRGTAAVISMTEMSRPR